MIIQQPTMQRQPKKCRPKKDYEAAQAYNNWIGHAIALHQYIATGLLTGRRGTLHY